MKFGLEIFCLHEASLVSQASSSLIILTLSVEKSWIITTLYNLGDKILLRFSDVSPNDSII